MYNGPVKVKLDCGHVQTFTMAEAKAIKAAREARDFLCTDCGTALYGQHLSDIENNA